MSQLGIRWRIDGVPAAFITRDPANPRYRVTFERALAALEQIEGIHWDHPTVERVTEVLTEPGLPEGYGFELLDLRYQHSAGIFVAEVRTAQQFLGDVTGYQAQLTEMEESLAAANAQLAELEAVYDAT